MKPAVLILGMLAAWSPGQDAKPEVLEEFDVARDGDGLCVPVTMQGKQYLFLVDTGATGNSVDITLPLGTPKRRVRVGTADKPVELALYDAPPAFLGQLSLQFAGPVLGEDLKSLREVSGLEIYGCLGMAFLWRHIVRIDFDAGKLSLLKEVGPDPGEPVSLALEEELPCVWVDISGRERRFVVDTGSCGIGIGCLSYDVFERMVGKKSLAVVGNTRNLSTAGPGETRLGRGREIRVGGLAVANPIYSEARVNGLGLGFLRRFTVTFDFPRQTMYLKKGKRYGEPVWWNRSGLHAKHRNGKLVVTRVDKGSPAAKSGICADDIVLSIGNRTADKSTPFQLHQQLIEADKQVHVTVQRGDQRIEATLVLRP